MTTFKITPEQIAKAQQEREARNLSEAERLAESGTLQEVYEAGNIWAQLERPKLAILREQIKERLRDRFNLNEFGTICNEARRKQGKPLGKVHAAPDAPLRDIDAKGIVPVLAEAICTDHHFAVDAGDGLYVYERGVYRFGGGKLITREVKARLSKWGLSTEWSSHRGREVVEYITADAKLLWDRPPLDRVNLLNGILDLEKQTLLPHSPAFLSPVQLGVNYDPDATCPNTEKFIAQVYPKDVVECGLPWQIRGYLMLPTNRHQKAFLLLGEGGNGKSRELASIEAFLGRDNYSTVPLHKLEADKFAASRIVGKLANICADLPTEDLSGTSTFKAITGGDAMMAERKYHDAFEIEPYARLVFSANWPPRSKDASEGFFRRWCVLPFEGRFDHGEAHIPEDQLDAMLADPAELSGVLNRVLEWLPQLDHGLSTCGSTEKALAEMRELTDPFAAWLKNVTESDPQGSIPADLFRDTYRKHTNNMQIKGFASDTIFTRTLRRLRPSVSVADRMTLGVRMKHYTGIKWKDVSGE